MPCVFYASAFILPLSTTLQTIHICWYRGRKEVFERRELFANEQFGNNSNVVYAGSNTPDENSMAGAEGATCGGGGSGSNVNTLGNTGINTALGTSATYNSISGLPNQNENNNCK